MTEDLEPVPVLSAAVVAYRDGLITARTLKALTKAGMRDVPDLTLLTVRQLSSLGRDAAEVAGELTRLVSPMTKATTADPTAETTVPRGSQPLRELLSSGQLSARTYNALVTSGCRTVGDVRARGAISILRLRNVGRHAIAELDAADVFANADEVPGEIERSDAPKEQEIIEDVIPKFALSELRRDVLRQVFPAHLEVLQSRPHRTLEQLAQAHGVTRERIRQIEGQSLRIIQQIIAVRYSEMARSWAAALDQPAVSEQALLQDKCNPEENLAIQFELGRIALRASFPKARPVKLFGGELGGYWCRTDRPTSLDQALTSLADSGPYSDDNLDIALNDFNIDPALGRAALALPKSPMKYMPRIRAWVRTDAQARDAALIALERASRPASPEAIARLIGVESPRNVAAALERDSRFRRLYAAHKWALTAWGDLGEGTRYRNTRDAISAILVAEGPMEYADLLARIHSVHPVSNWAVANTLEDDIFGRLPDGRVDLTSSGALPFREREPRHGDEVQILSDALFEFFLPVTNEMVRGSGTPIPHYVTWRLGLTNVPSKRTLSTRGGSGVTFSRTPGLASISSLRHSVSSLNLSASCILRVIVNPSKGTAIFGAACACHAPAGLSIDRQLLRRRSSARDHPRETPTRTPKRRKSQPLDDGSSPLDELRDTLVIRKPLGRPHFREPKR